MDQLKQLIAGLSLKQKLSIVVAAVLTVGGVLGFIHYKRESDFRTLFTSMAPEDAAAVVGKLRENGVEYRLAESGGAVSVPSSKLAESRLALAAAGLPKTGRIGFELFDRGAFGATEFVEHINYKRALEGELERSVMSLAEIEEARVHLTLAKESIFVEKQQPAKASVMVKLRPGARLAPQNVFAVANLVASAVEGLTPESVSIVDMAGNLLNRPRRVAEDDGAQVSAESLEMRKQIDRDITAKIGSTLEPFLGEGRYRVGASVDYDMTSGDQQDETVDPTHSVMVSSQKTEDVSERASTSGGVPGTAANLPGAQAAHPTGGGGTSRRTENVVYQSSRSVRRTRIPQGVVRKISIAVLVDNNVRWEGEGSSRRRVLEPPSAETLKTIRELVAATTGFNAERGDQITIESLPFESSRNAEPPPLPPGSIPAPSTRQPAWMERLLANRVLIGAAVGGAVVLMFLSRILLGLVFRKRKRVLAVAEVPDADKALPPGGIPHTSLAPVGAAPLGLNDASALELAARVSNFAESEAMTAANVIRLWLQEEAVR